ncbi:MAG: iron-siderophore ABC transporter substrate-binding protein [Leptolyngbya sp. SIO4C5]|nr:iron-siderophore ABC transporter substrate-binding protein [Leptolyngbya sp. SIO4C5]
MPMLKRSLLLGLMLAIAACQSPPDSQIAASTKATADESCRTVDHALGETEICGQPQNVVVLGPYLLEQVLALGVQPVGFADHVVLHQGDYDSPSQQIPYLGQQVTTQPANVGLAYQPSIEAILSLQPDLILSPTIGAEQYDVLSDIAPTLMFDVTEGKTNLQAIAQALDRAEQVEGLMATTEERIEAAQEMFAPLVADHPQILMLTSDDAHSFSLISHRNSRCGALPKELGFEPVYPAGLDEAALKTPASVSIEVLPQLNTADSIILFAYDWDASAGDPSTFDNQQIRSLKQAWENNAIAQSLDASQAGRVYYIPAYLCLGLPGPIGTELYLAQLREKLLSSPE